LGARIEAYVPDSERRAALKKYYLAVLVLLFLSACGTSITPSPSSTEAIVVASTSPSGVVTYWLITPTCEAPCWENIAPGETTLEQAKSLLLNNPNIKRVAEDVVTSYGLKLSVDIQGDKYAPNVLLGFDKNNINQFIEFLTFGENLHVSDITAIYGSPRYVVVYGRETVGVDVDLLYPEMGLVVNLYSEDADIISESDIRFSVSPEQEVFRISYYVPTFEYYYSFAWQPLKRYEWKGFTDYP
jgi:hypothetical protein